MWMGTKKVLYWRRMLRLSKMADYGILLLVRVAACEAGRVHTARDLAAYSRLPMTTVSKVVKSLARQGLLVSRRGMHGGYALARAAEAISVVDVIAAMEGPVALTACASHAGRGCELVSTCPTRAPWHRLNAIVVSTLAGVSLADMHAAPPHPFSGANP